MNRKIIKPLFIASFVTVVLLNSIFRIETIDQFKTESLRNGEITKTIDFTSLWYPTGYVKINLGTFTDIVDIGVKEGDSVTAGQYLAQLNNANEYNQFRAAQLGYYAAINAKKSASSGTTTSIVIPAIAGIPGSTAITIPITIPSLTSAAQLQNAINTSYYQMLTAENNLAKKILKSPISGKVVAVVQEDFSPSSSSTASLTSGLSGLTGATAMPTASTGNYIVIASTTDTRVSASFSDQDIVTIKNGMEVEFTNKLTDEIHKAKVTSVSMVPVTQLTSVTEEPVYKTIITLDKYPALPYGTKLEGNIYIERKLDTPYLPYDAVTLDSTSKGTVLVYDTKSMKTLRKSVEIGLVGNDVVEIRSGVEKDEQIVIDRATSKKIIALQPWVKTLLRIK